MSRKLWCMTLGLTLMGMMGAPDAWAQRRWGLPPQIGCVFPAGARQGETVEVLIRGQYFANAKEIHVSGEGVQADLVEIIKPLTGKQMAVIRDIGKKARNQAKEEAKQGRRGGPLVVRRFFLEMAKEKGITEKQLEAFKRYRMERADPKRQLNPQLAESMKIRITLSADAEPGMRELRVSSARGLSNPIRFCIGRLPECSETEPNDKTSEATLVPSLPMVLNGQIMPGDRDTFRIKARKGQKLVVNVAARELIPYLADAVPGWFQATVALYDAEGHEVAFVDDYRFDPDPVLLFEVPRDGDYILEIRDSIYRGREDFVYRIALGELPFVSSIFPLGGRQGERVTVSMEGWNLPSARSVLDLSAAEVGRRPFRVEGKACVSNTTPFAVNDLPELRETEPNNNPDRAGKMVLPLVLNGRLPIPRRQGARHRCRGPSQAPELPAGFHAQTH